MVGKPKCFGLRRGERERESAGEGEPGVAGARERERHEEARVVRSVGEGDSESEK